MIFQIIDIYEDENNKYVIHIFGRNINNKSIHLKILGWKPYFYMLIKSSNKNDIKKEQLNIDKKLLNVYKGNYIGSKLVRRKKFHGYGSKYLFLKLVFKNTKNFNNIKKLFKSYEFYETNMIPFIKFLHTYDIKPSGWVIVEKYEECYESTCDIDISTKYKYIKPYDSNDIAPFVISSFDIKCCTNEIIQIGTTTNIINSNKTIKYIACLNKTDEVDGVIVEYFQNEKELLIGWSKYIIKTDPDVLTGYNINGFDFDHIYKRLIYHEIIEDFHLSRLKTFKTSLKETNLSSSAMGNNLMKYINTPGRVNIDLYKYVNNNFKFSSYKLDDIVGEFINGKIKNYNILEPPGTSLTITNNIELNIGDFIGINYNDYNILEINGKNKFQIIDKYDDKIIINQIIKLPDNSKITWKLMKDDYCIQNCLLCNNLLEKLKILINNIAMSNICFVPISFLFFRGQGIKAYSIVAYKCNKLRYLIKDKNVKDFGDSYKGGSVLQAYPGIYTDPISCNDFASLYPSSIISHNLSPDTLILNNKCNKDVETINCDGNVYKFVKPDEGDFDNEAERPGRGIIPLVLIELLESRKQTKKLMEIEKDPFKHAILDGLQLSYKLTSNSLYGQMGSKFSEIVCKPVAESTTSIGRLLLDFATTETKKLYPTADIIYGDTDSIMVKYINIPENADVEVKQDAIKKSIDCAMNVEKIVSAKLPWPHKLEYEKTFCPMVLYSKKVYTGYKYVNDPENIESVENKGNIIVRRDNCKIVKYIFNGCLDIILNNKDEDVNSYITKNLRDIIKGKFSLDFFIKSNVLNITKTMPAHRILADRIAKRNNGKAPQINERISYIHVEYPPDKINRKKGDLIEDVEYFKQNNLKIDYKYYIIKQIMKPINKILEIYENGDIDLFKNFIKYMRW